MNNIGKLLIAYRQKHDLIIGQVASEIDVSSSTISRLEAGKMVDAENLLKVINWLFKMDKNVTIVDRELYKDTALGANQ